MTVAIETNAPAGRVSFKPCSPETLLASVLSFVQQGPSTLNVPGSDKANRPPIVFPVYWGGLAATPWDFIKDQSTFDEACAEVERHLNEESLPEFEMLDILDSGILQRPLGRALAPVLVEAVLDSITPPGNMTEQQLREMVEVICYYPPGKWMNTFGERRNFPKGADGKGVAGFIQAQMDRSRLQRDERIANGELLTDAQWQSLQQIVKDCRPCIDLWLANRGKRSAHTVEPLDDTLCKLEDFEAVRPKPGEAKILLGELLGRLQKIDDFPAVHRQAIEELWQGIVVTPVSPWSNAFQPEPVHAQSRSTRAANQNHWLIETLEEIERKGEYNQHVVIDGPHVPNSWAGKFLWAVNALDTVGLLGIAEKIRPHLPLPPPAQTASAPMDLLHEAGVLAQNIDALLSKIIAISTGWQPVAAFEQTDPDRLLPGTVEQLQYDPTLMTTATQWLQASSAYAAGAALMTLSNALRIVQDNPGASTTLVMTAIYRIVLDFQKRWFPEDTDRPDLAHELDPERHGWIVFGVEQTLMGIPQLAKTLSDLVGNRTSADLFSDPTVLARVEDLLQQPAPDDPERTIEDQIEQSVGQALKEFAELHDQELPKVADKVPAEANEAAQRSGRRKRAVERVLEASLKTDVSSAADTLFKNNVIKQMLDKGNVPLPIPEGTLFARKLYKQILKDKALQQFFTDNDLDPTKLRIHHDSVSGPVTRDGVTTLRTFTLWDNSGWWQVSKMVRQLAQFIDPQDYGLPGDPETITPDVVLKFYGVEPPTSQAEARTLAEKLQKDGWPVITEGQKARIVDSRKWVEKANEEREQTALLIDALEQSVKGQPNDETVPLADTIADFVIGPLMRKSKEIRHHLHNFFALPAMQEICTERVGDCNDLPYRICEEKIELFAYENWVDLTDSANAQPALKAALTQLIEHTKGVGHALYSSDAFDLMQMIRYQGYDAPTNVAEVRNIIRWLRSDLPPSPPLGDYGAQFLSGDVSSISFSQNDKSQLIELAKTLAGESPSIIDALADERLRGLSVDKRRADADALMSELLNSRKAQDWGRQCLEKLNWYCSEEDPASLTADSQALLATAIKLSVDPDAPGMPPSIAGYHVYQGKNRGRAMNDIREEIERHLVENKGVSELAAPLVAHLFLADIAPEFLVHGIDSGIAMGTSQWMTLSLGVAIAEETHPGCSRGLSVEQLIILAGLDPATDESRLLLQKLGVEIILAWGVMNGAVRLRETSAYTLGDYLEALRMLQLQQRNLGTAFNTFSAPLEPLEDMAIRLLRRVFPDASYREIKEMKLWIPHDNPDREGKKAELHLVHVYMAGGLKPGHWSFSETLAFADFEKKILDLPDLGEVFSAAVDDYFEAFRKAFITPLKLLFAELPLEDRQFLELGEVQLYVLREETGKILRLEEESHKLERTAEQGYVLVCRRGKKVRNYEIFPVQMLIVPRPDLPSELPLEGKIIKKMMRFSSGPAVSVDVRVGEKLPFDAEAHFAGTAPRPNVESPKLIIQKLGDSFAGRTLVGYPDESAYIPNTYYSNKIAAIIDRMVGGNFMRTQKAFFLKDAKGISSEASRVAFWRKIRDFVLQLIPFVGCVNDLRSGTKEGVFRGVFGCFADAVSLLMGLAGGVLKLASVFKAISPLRLKAFQALKVTTGTVISVVNPFSGFPDLIVGTARGFASLGKMMKTGVFYITDKGVTRLKDGIGHINTFFGGMVSPRASARVPMRIASPITKGTHDGKQKEGIKVDGQWYLPHANGQRPIGPPLRGFLPDTPQPLRVTPQPQ
ncbi:hypothetical protein K9857_24605 [Pseudomonas sp. REP124]|uniref:hypothetical protein n=1 Tax=Pseudomonas sp. REP124 TaxID=2875731 RepID=UPI001CCD9344|nr:hypothetical protein [Pseudomonas sp. REP124]MBZ9784726.1 hypothetical protein [Pseudomonas sp. REP124]